jgi:hypothetical protein
MKNNLSVVADINISAYHKDEPVAIRIVKSGWSTPQQYHVLIEFGDFSDTDYKGLMTADQIKEKYNIKVADSESLTSYTNRLPNDLDLGKTIRNVGNKFKQNLL